MTRSRPARRFASWAGDQLFISLRAEVDGIPRQRVLTWRRATLPGGVLNQPYVFRQHIT
jgi:hypothetical protein